MSTEQLGPDEPIETRSSIQTAEGTLDVVARTRGERWWVSASRTDQTGAGIGPELGIALLAALDLCDVHAQELER